MEERGILISVFCFPCKLLQPDVTIWKCSQRTWNDHVTPESTAVFLVFSSSDGASLPQTTQWDCCLPREDAAYADHHPVTSSAHNCLHQLGKIVELFGVELLGLPQTPVRVCKTSECHLRHPVTFFFSHHFLPCWTSVEGWFSWGQLHLVVINLVSWHFLWFSPYHLSRLWALTSFTLFSLFSHCLAAQFCLCVWFI